MTAPSWQEDDPNNLSLIQSNAAQLITELRAAAAESAAERAARSAAGVRVARERFTWDHAVAIVDRLLSS